MSNDTVNSQLLTLVNALTNMNKRNIFFTAFINFFDVS